MAETPHISLVTLGVDDLARSRRFYEALGFVPSAASTATVAFYPAGPVALALFGRASLAADAAVPDTPGGFAAIALAWNVGSEAAVDRVMTHAAACGARITKPAGKVFWGGYSGYFADPDGHLWEVAWNPFSPLGPDGRMTLPPPAPTA